MLAYLFRAVFYAGIGVSLAILLFNKVVLPLEMRYPFHFPFGDVFLKIGPENLLLTGLLIMVVAVVSTLLPLIGVMRMKIISAIWS